MISTISREGILLCLAGPAGSGKTTLGEQLIKQNSATLHRSISVTTRSPRMGEVSGREYHFVSQSRFDEMVAEGAFFEWEEIHGNKYGTPRAEFENAIRSGRDTLLIIDIRGALTIKRTFPKNAIIAFVIPPSFKELSARMKQRGTVIEGELAKRLQTATSEYHAVQALANPASSETKSELDYLIVNDSLESSFNELDSILKAERSRFARLEREGLKILLKTL